MLTVDPFTRLADVTFCVLDLETTGTSDEADEIVEVGAVLVRGGETLGSLQTMVRHPLATGPADVPTLGAVLASLLEFVRGSVIVGHNISFDLRFMNAAFWKSGHQVQWCTADAIDTVALARRLLRDDADDCRLGTLAQRFQFDTTPTHRALADAQATVELLHLLIERATHYGALDLDDLMRLPSLLRHRHRAKLAVTAALPRVPGVACLRDRSGSVLHVVDADDVRHGVRSLFDHESGRGLPGTVLQHLHVVEHLAAPHPVLARIASLRWRTSMLRARRARPVHLQAPASASGRLRSTADRNARGVVAGPLDRVEARDIVAALAQQPIEHTRRLVAALAPAGAPDDVVLSQPLLAGLVEREHVVAAVRHITTPAVVDGAVLHLDDGRVVDVVVDGRSYAHLLPAAAEGDRPGRRATEARTAEALLVGRLMGIAGSCTV